MKKISIAILGLLVVVSLLVFSKSVQSSNNLKIALSGLGCLIFIFLLGIYVKQKIKK